MVSPLLICSYEDRPEAMDSVILMGESLCRVDTRVCLHLTVPEAPASVRAWAKSRPQVALSTARPKGVSGWDVKPWLLLQELNAGATEALWLDTDIVATRPISGFLNELLHDSFIVAEEWNRPEPMHLSHLWELPPGRPVPPVNSCFLRATRAHRRLLERWLEMTHEPRYRQAQALPFERRPFHLASDQVLLTALLGSAEFSQVTMDCIRIGPHIAQCAGSSGYRPGHRLLDLVRGLPPLIHCIGRKPWEPTGNQSRIQRFLLDLATDVSPYSLAARKVARGLGMSPPWLDARTSLGAALRGATGHHPGMAGLPLAILHSVPIKMGQLMVFTKRSVRDDNSRHLSSPKQI